MECCLITPGVNSGFQPMLADRALEPTLRVCESLEDWPQDDY